MKGELAARIVAFAELARSGERTGRRRRPRRRSRRGAQHRRRRDVLAGPRARRPPLRLRAQRGRRDAARARRRAPRRDDLDRREAGRVAPAALLRPRRPRVGPGGRRQRPRAAPPRPSGGCSTTTRPAELTPAIARGARRSRRAVRRPRRPPSRGPPRQHPVLAGMVPAMTRMTITPTGLQTHEPANVIPPFADVICDCRALPGQGLDDVREQLDRALAGIEYELELLEPLEGGTESPTDTPLYRICEEYVRERLPGAELLPIVTPGFTDSHWVRGGARDRRLRLRAGLLDPAGRLPRRHARRRRGDRRRRPRRDDGLQPRGAIAALTSPRLDALERRDDQLADRVEVVAALLDDRGRQPESAEQLAGGAVALGGDLERALGIAAGGVDAERDDEAARAGRAGELAERRRPPPATGRRRSRARAAGSGSRPRRRRRRARRRSRGSGGTSRRRGRRGPSRWRPSGSAQKIDWAPLPWWASTSRIATGPPSASRSIPAAAAALLR